MYQLFLCRLFKQHIRFQSIEKKLKIIKVNFGDVLTFFSTQVKLIGIFIVISDSSRFTKTKTRDRFSARQALTRNRFPALAFLEHLQ